MGTFSVFVLNRGEGVFCSVLCESPWIAGCFNLLNYKTTILYFGKLAIVCITINKCSQRFTKLKPISFIQIIFSLYIEMSQFSRLQLLWIMLFNSCPSASPKSELSKHELIVLHKPTHKQINNIDTCWHPNCTFKYWFLI